MSHTRSIGLTPPGDLVDWLDKEAQARKIGRSQNDRLTVEWAQENREGRQLVLR